MYELILVPLDGSHQAEKALTEAAKVAQHRGAIVTLLQVVPSFDEFYGSVQPNPLDAAEQTQDSLARAAYDEANTAAREYLKHVATAIKGCGFEVVTRVAEGDSADRIIEAAAATEAQVIVLTPYGASASSTTPAGGVFGRVADEVLRRAQVPVLVAKH